MVVLVRSLSVSQGLLVQDEGVLGSGECECIVVRKERVSWCKGLRRDGMVEHHGVIDCCDCYVTHAALEGSGTQLHSKRQRIK